MSLNRDTGRDRYFAQRELELDELVDRATGMVSERFARQIACPLCGEEDYRTIFVKRGFPFVRCRHCRLVFANPQVDETLVLEEYRAGSSNDLWVDVLTSPRQLELDRKKFAAVLDLLEHYRGGGRVLDVGCSIGLFLALARERGWQGTGIEFGERALAYARDELGLDVVDTPLEEGGFAPESFDAVTLLSVIEHANQPRELIRQAARVLRPGGALYVVTPNVESLACRVLHERAATFDGRNHLVYFSRATLLTLLQEEGFGVPLVTTQIGSLDPILEWLAFEEPYSDADLSGDPLAEQVRTQDLWPLLEERDLGYKLHCLAVRS